MNSEMVMDIAGVAPFGCLLFLQQFRLRTTCMEGE